MQRMPFCVRVQRVVTVKEGRALQHYWRRLLKCFNQWDSEERKTYLKSRPRGIHGLLFILLIWKFHGGKSRKTVKQSDNKEFCSKAEPEQEIQTPLSGAAGQKPAIHHVHDGVIFTMLPPTYHNTAEL